MYKYLITHNEMPGEEVIISYNADGRLLKWDANDMHSMNEKQLQFLKAKTPILLTEPTEQLSQLIEATGNKIKITQTSFDVSFSVFWDAYDNKRHRLPAQKLFEKLSYADKLKCINSCATYQRYCNKNASWYNKQLPDTYISKRNFETEWHKMK